MTSLSLSTSRARFAGIALACAGLLLWWSCDENPVLPALPGGTWTLEADTISSMVNSTYQHTSSIGASATLYAGFTAETEPREAGILLKFGNVDSTQLANIDSARLLIFRRSFPSSPEPPRGLFTLEYILAENADTIWVEADTGLTVEQFTLTEFVSSAVLDSDSVLVFTGSTSMTKLPEEHLEFEVGQQLLKEWRTGTLANNGFLLRAPQDGNLVSFHSSEVVRTPYLAVSYHDTTDTGTVVIETDYYRATFDMSAYPRLVDIPEEGMLLLNRSDDHRVHINFADSLKAREVSDSLAAREPRPIAGGRLVFKVDTSANLMQAGTMVLHVGLRSQPIAQGDSAMIDYANFTYQANSDTLVYNLTSLLVDYQKGVRDNYGLDLMVTGSTHDFDRLTLFDPHLEIIYAVPFGAGE